MVAAVNGTRAEDGHDRKPPIWASTIRQSPFVSSSSAPIRKEVRNVDERLNDPFALWN